MTKSVSPSFPVFREQISHGDFRRAHVDPLPRVSESLRGFGPDWSSLLEKGGRVCVWAASMWMHESSSLVTYPGNPPGKPAAPRPELRQERPGISHLKHAISKAAGSCFPRNYCICVKIIPCLPPRGLRLFRDETLWKEAIRIKQNETLRIPGLGRSPP